MAKSTDYSYRGPEFSSQQSHQVAHNHLKFMMNKGPMSMSGHHEHPTLMCTYTDKDTANRKHMFKNINLLKIKKCYQESEKTIYRMTEK